MVFSVRVRVGKKTKQTKITQKCAKSFYTNFYIPGWSHWVSGRKAARRKEEAEGKARLGTAPKSPQELSYHVIMEWKS